MLDSELKTWNQSITNLKWEVRALAWLSSFDFDFDIAVDNR